MIRINGYVIDAALSEEHTFESTVTAYPVESGGEIADNVRPSPITVTIEGVVSDSPIGDVADIRARAQLSGQLTTVVSPAGSSSPPGKPSEDALAQLIKIRDLRIPITIETSLKVFDRMLMTNLVIPRSADDPASALHFTATFQQVEIVTNNRTTIKVASVRGGKKFNYGDLPVIDPKTGRLRKLYYTVDTAHRNRYASNFLFSRGGREYFQASKDTPPAEGYIDGAGNPRPFAHLYYFPGSTGAGFQALLHNPPAGVPPQALDEWLPLGSASEPFPPVKTLP